MANAAEIADLLTRGMQGPTGPEDAAFHTGVIKSWARDTGINVVTVNGVDIANMKSLQAGIPNAYSAGDVVCIIRKQTQYFIMGKVSAPGGQGSSGIRSSFAGWINEFDTGGVFADNPSVPNSPQISTWIGSSRNVLIMWQCGVEVRSGDTALGSDWYNDIVQGEVGFSITGASTIAAGLFAGTSVFHNVQSWNPGGLQGVQSKVTLSGQIILGAADGINTGTNVFTMKYKTISGRKATFDAPGLIIMPF